MSIQTELQTALAGTAGGGPHHLVVHQDDCKLTCEIAQLDPLAVTLTRLSLWTDALAGATLAELQKISEDLAARVTYLLEPIGPIESDSEGCMVQMRSVPPQQGEDGTLYYELLVRRGGELSLGRYQHEPNLSRQPVPCTLTREVLLRLVGDFEAVLG